jgi:hypothetical protein
MEGKIRINPTAAKFWREKSGPHMILIYSAKKENILFLLLSPLHSGPADTGAGGLLPMVECIIHTQPSFNAYRSL